MATQRAFEDTFAAGWNARCDKQPFDTTKPADWKQGWKDADRTDAAERVPFNRTVVQHA